MRAATVLFGLAPGRGSLAGADLSQTGLRLPPTSRTHYASLTPDTRHREPRSCGAGSKNAFGVAQTGSFYQDVTYGPRAAACGSRMSSCHANPTNHVRHPVRHPMHRPRARRSLI
jgi:hypothetical protein